VTCIEIMEDGSRYVSVARFGGLGLKTTCGWFARFGPQNSRLSSRQHVASCYEGLVAVRCMGIYLDHFAPRIKWLNQNI
jgi:hypothetical protein